jgi:hypothetical protein
MAENEFKIGNRSFKLMKIDAFKQFHLVRRMAPILAELIPAMAEISKVQKKKKSNSEEEKFDQLAKFLSPVITGISKLSDEDSDKVLMGLLEAVEMKQAEFGNWARLVSNGNLMFQDLDLATMLQCAGRAFMYNLQGFFSALPQKS